MNVNPTNANYVDLARNPTGPNVTMTETFHQTINFTTGGSEQFGGDENFPRGGGDNFLIRATGFIKIPTTGIYTINGAHDDAFFVNIGTNYNAGTGIDEQNCCGSNPRQVFLTAGVYPVEVIMAEFGGGEHVEFGIGAGVLANGSPALALAGAAGHPAGIQIHQSAAALGGLTPVPQNFVPQGWTVQVQNASATPGVVGGTVDNINEGVALINGGGAPEAQAITSLLNFTDNAFPAGTNEDDFALYARGFVDVLFDSGQITGALFVNSDDGFRLLVNGQVVSEFAGPTGGSNTLSGIVTLKDNDLIEFFFFERGGGEFAFLQFDVDGSGATTGDRFFLGDTGGGIAIRTALIPEPASALLGVMGMGVLGLRRRRTA